MHFSPQCEGDLCLVDLLVRDPACDVSPNVHPVAGGQHGGAGPRPEGRRPQGKGSPQGGREDPSSFSSASNKDHAAFIPSEENLQADAASRFQLVPDWHLDSQVFRLMASLWGHPQIDLFASLQSAQTLRFMSLRAADSPEAIDALSMRWDFKLAYLFPPILLLKRVVRKLELSRGVFLLFTPYWEAQTWFASLQALQVLEVHRLPFHNNLVVDLSTGEPPPSLKWLFLVVWKICGGLGESTQSQIGPSTLSRQGGSNPQKIATKGPGGPSKPSCALPPFLSVKRL
jgi:hypothetical protein